MSALKGKIVVITAAAQGIGRASAEALGRRGAASDRHGHQRRPRSATSRRGRCFSVASSTCWTRPRSRRSSPRSAGSTSSSIAPAWSRTARCWSAREDDLDFAFDLNVKAMARTIRAVLPGMIERRDGCIVNMASVASSVKGVPNRFAYGVTKAAVIGLTKSVAADYVASGIRCNAICPGTVERPSLQQRLGAPGRLRSTRAAFVARQPIGRIGAPEEIADLVVYLAGATYTTGQIHIIDGGWTI